MQSLPAVGRGQRKNSLRLCAFARIEKITHEQSKNISAPQYCGTGSEDAKAQRKKGLTQEDVKPAHGR